MKRKTKRSDHGYRIRQDLFGDWHGYRHGVQMFLSNNEDDARRWVAKMNACEIADWMYYAPVS